MKVYLLSFLLTITVTGCLKNSDKNSDNMQNDKQLNEQLIEANKAVVNTESKQIDEYIQSKGWKMETTGTGLRYMLLKKGRGNQARTGQQVTIKYETRLISGELIYSSDIQGVKEFELGSGGVESGLEEGILLMHPGDKIRFVIPSHLAFGLTGDQDKIPQRATLVYDVELLDLK